MTFLVSIKKQRARTHGFAVQLVSAIWKLSEPRAEVVCVRQQPHSGHQVLVSTPCLSAGVLWCLHVQNSQAL